ncbi:hypothetical protein [Eubacterium ramulus]|uniref:Uncharacterized protein n=1 Tax=Eubacterium ramulus TaxID=39490 RepID=A0A173UAX7_EUBRA|nr:hypothetical protein [Eubacterium ramulus]CUN11984.1 Uncharacterised protein [Eubacterium ramulus]
MEIEKEVTKFVKTINRGPESFIKTFKDDDEENKEVINSEELEPYDILNLKTTLENRLSEIRPLICK